MVFRRLVALSLGLILALHFAQLGLAQESRNEISQRVRFVREQLNRGLHVQYSVNQAVADPKIRYGLVHFGSSSDGSSLIPFWHAEHAMAGSREFHRSSSASTGYKDSDRILVFDEHYFFSLLPLTQVVGAYKKSLHDVGDLPLDASPVEELYWELIGFQSRSGKKRITVSGSTQAYDILTVLADGSYAIEAGKNASSEPTVILTKPGVERIELDPKYDYAMIHRERNWDSSDTLKIVLSNSKFELVDGKVWLPKESVINYYPEPENEFAGSVAVKSTLSADQISLNPPEKLLIPDLTGMIQVMDLHHQSDGKVAIKPVFIKDLDGSKLSEFLKEAPRGIGPNPYKSNSTKENVNITSFAIVTLFGFVLMVVLWRRNRGTSK